MKIRFVQNYRLYRQGDVVETSQDRADVMVLHGFAEIVDAPAKAVRKEVAKESKRTRKAVKQDKTEE